MAVLAGLFGAGYLPDPDPAPEPVPSIAKRRRHRAKAKRKARAVRYVRRSIARVQ